LGFAVSCDGAGSAVNSHFGSKFIAGEASNLFKHIVETNDWHKQQSLPTQAKWQILSKKAFAKLRYDLGEFAKAQDFVVETLACTVIVVIHSPIGILVTHIGDGRAAFCDINQNRN
jgi:serine/threonine protein phosphatase PrpC